jgi:hypothetical protein
VAATLAGARLTDAHRRAQAAIGRRGVRQLLAVWPLLDPADLDGSVSRWLGAAVPAVEARYMESATLARSYYQSFRSVEVPGADPFDLPDVLPLNVEAVSTSLLVQGPIKVKVAVGAGQLLAEALTTASLTSAAAGERHALSGGREAILGAADADPAARTTRRVASPGCCAFCAMLAARSYDGLTSDATGSGRAFMKVHDGCRCQPETVFVRDPRYVERHIREFASLYHDSQVDREPGTKNPALTAFRRALEAQRQGG